MRLGLDIGSTTIKCVVLDDNDKLLYSTYEDITARLQQNR